MPSAFFRIATSPDGPALLDPRGRQFFSIGLNHIDPAALRGASSRGAWTRTGNSMKRWLGSVRRDLRSWGFNSVGWTQEVVIRGKTIHRHSPPFTFEEYQWLSMPYCHLLPFAEIHQWDLETPLPDFFSRDFEDWCDYIARAHCARFRDDPKLIGYFYSDCPMWVHTRQLNRRKGSLFDPARLRTARGRKQLFDLATRYYRVTHAAVRRYDGNHLILGDRYEAQAPLPTEVLAAACRYVDVLSFQHFGKPETVAADLRRWQRQTGKPVLLADHATIIRRRDGSETTDPAAYAQMLALCRQLPGCIGFHLCGAYIRNNARKRGLRDERGTVDRPLVAAIRRANRELR